MTKGFYYKLLLAIIFGVGISVVLVEPKNFMYLIECVLAISMAVAVVIDDVIDEKFNKGDCDE